MKINYEKITTIPSLEAFGFAADTGLLPSGTEDMPPQGRIRNVLLTEDKAAAAGDIQSTAMRHYRDNGIRIQFVEKGDISLLVEFIGGMKSPITVDFKGVYIAKSDDLIEIFFDEDGYDDDIDELDEARKGMSAAHPECCNRYKVVDAQGRRVILRLYKRQED